MQSSVISNMEHFTPDMITLIGEVNRLEDQLYDSQTECRRLRLLLTRALSGKVCNTNVPKEKAKTKQSRQNLDAALGGPKATTKALEEEEEVKALKEKAKIVRDFWEVRKGHGT